MVLTALSQSIERGVRPVREGDVEHLVEDGGVGVEEIRLVEDDHVLARTAGGALRRHRTDDGDAGHVVLGRDDVDGGLEDVEGLVLRAEADGEPGLQVRLRLAPDRLLDLLGRHDDDRAVAGHDAELAVVGDVRREDVLGDGLGDLDDEGAVRRVDAEDLVAVLVLGERRDDGRLAALDDRHLDVLGVRVEVRRLRRDRDDFELDDLDVLAVEALDDALRLGLAVVEVHFEAVWDRAGRRGVWGGVVRLVELAR